MKTKTFTQWIVSLSLAIITTLNTDAAAYIKIGDIKGEARGDGHEEWIDVLSFNQGIHRPKGGMTGATRRRSSAKFSDLVVVKELDKASPKLAESVATGTVIPEAVLDLTVETDQGEVTYYRYELKNVMVTSYQISSDNPDLLPVESFSLNFEEIKVTYTGLEINADGTPSAVSEFNWKVEKGR